jgi:N-acetylglucosaminyldiphosphoundecaprenol N-acetyl-beta-D-mannosaminyltransferase
MIQPALAPVNLPSNLRILGVRVDDVTMSESLEHIAALVAEGGVHQAATVNPEFIMAAQRNADFARVLEGTALNVPDGVGLLWAARRMGRPLRERVAGVDLVRQLCALGSQYRWQVYFLGAREGVAQRAAANLAFKYQGLVVAGTYSGSPRPEDEAEILARVSRAQPNLLLVAYGAPAQDLWLARNLPRLAEQLAALGGRPAGSPVGLVGIGVGGSLDYIAGVQTRAPTWVQHMNLEWLWRLGREPRRWRRQTALLRFVWRVMLQSP